MFLITKKGKKMLKEVSSYLDNASERIKMNSRFLKIMEERQMLKVKSKEVSSYLIKASERIKALGDIIEAASFSIEELERSIDIDDDSLSNADTDVRLDDSDSELANRMNDFGSDDEDTQENSDISSDDSDDSFEYDIDVSDTAYSDYIASSRRV